MIYIIYNMFLKYFISMNLILLSLLSLFFSDLMTLWFFMEIINFMFICSLNLLMNKKKLIFFYFLVQIIPSFLIIFSIIINNMIFLYNFSNSIIIMGLLMKLSIPPFHYWLILMSLPMPWYSLFFLLTIQKITPFYFLSLMNMNMMFMYLILLLCSITPPLMMMKSNNFKILLSYSSINQSGWMMILIYMKNIIWFKYFMLYSSILLCMFTIIYMNKMFKSNIYFSLYKLKMMSLIYMLNMASMPPFSFFILKWYSIFLMIMNTNLYMIMMLMIMSSLMMLYLYTLMLIKSMFFYSLNSKIIKFNYHKLYLNKMIMMFFLTLSLSSIIFMI